MSAIRPAGSPEQHFTNKAEVKNGKLYINGIQHEVKVKGSNNPVAPVLLSSIANEVNSNRMRPGQDNKLGEYTFDITPKPLPTKPQNKVTDVAKILTKPVAPPRTNRQDPRFSVAPPKEQAPSPQPKAKAASPERPPRKDEPGYKPPLPPLPDQQSSSPK